MTSNDYINQIIVGRGDWLGNPANIKVENNAVGYVMESPWPWLNKLINAMFPLVNNFKMIGMLLNVVHGHVQKSLKKKTYNKGFPNHSTLINCNQMQVAQGIGWLFEV